MGGAVPEPVRTSLDAGRRGWDTPARVGRYGWSRPHAPDPGVSSGSPTQLRTSGGATRGEPGAGAKGERQLRYHPFAGAGCVGLPGPRRPRTRERSLRGRLRVISTTEDEAPDRYPPTRIGRAGRFARATGPLCPVVGGGRGLTRSHRHHLLAPRTPLLRALHRRSVRPTRGGGLGRGVG